MCRNTMTKLKQFILEDHKVKNKSRVPLTKQRITILVGSLLLVTSNAFSDSGDCCQKIACLKKRQDILLNMANKYLIGFNQCIGFSQNMKNITQAQTVLSRVLQELISTIIPSYVKLASENKENSALFTSIIDVLAVDMEIVSKKIDELEKMRSSFDSSLNNLTASLNREEGELKKLIEEWCK